MFLRIKSRLKTYFFTGLLILLPAIVSIKVFLWFIKYVDGFFGSWLQHAFGSHFFGVGIGVTIMLTLVVGMFAQNYFGKKLAGLVDSIFDRLPFIRTIYSVVRQLIQPFSSEGGKSFRQVVLVEYPMAGRLAIGFVANEHVGSLDGDKLLTVFLPSNHLHLGYLVILPESQVIHVDLTVEEALKMIVSCGIVVPKLIDIKDMKLVAGPAAQ